MYRPSGLTAQALTALEWPLNSISISKVHVGADLSAYGRMNLPLHNCSIDL